MCACVTNGHADTDAILAVCLPPPSVVCLPLPQSYDDEELHRDLVLSSRAPPASPMSGNISNRRARAAYLQQAELSSKSRSTGSDGGGGVHDEEEGVPPSWATARENVENHHGRSATAAAWIERSESGSGRNPASSGAAYEPEREQRRRQKEINRAEAVERRAGNRKQALLLHEVCMRTQLLYASESFQPQALPAFAQVTLARACYHLVTDWPHPYRRAYCPRWQVELAATTTSETTYR